MPGGGSDKVEQTNKVELTPEQRELIKKGMGQIDQSLSGGTPQLPGVQGFDPLQNQAQQGVVNKSTNDLQTMSANLGKAQNFLTGDVMNLDSNPAMKQALDASLRPLSENFRDVVMPGLRTNAISAGPGALGSPKDNVRQGIAAGQYMREVGDTSAKFLNTAYGQNLDALAKGITLAPQSMQASLFPEAALETVGAQRRELANQQGAQGFNQQMLPFNLGMQMLGGAGAMPGAGSTSTVSGAQPKSDWTQLLGAGLSAASAMAGAPIFM
jgi:hypothetical protein